MIWLMHEQNNYHFVMCINVKKNYNKISTNWSPTLPQRWVCEKYMVKKFKWIFKKWLHRSYTSNIMHKAMLQGHILDQYEYVVGSDKGSTFTYTCLCMFYSLNYFFMWLLI
jgi:hypothetical protein